MIDRGSSAARGIERWFRAALAAVEPGAAVRSALRLDGRALIVDETRVPIDGRVLVVGIGKAAVPMTAAVLDVLDGVRNEAFVNTKDGHDDGRLQGRASVVEAAHPVVDERGVAATTAIVRTVARLGRGDLVVVLLSGGGSALFELPLEPLSLSDLGETTDLLLRAGAPIEDLNAVRIPLSAVKGGGFRRFAPAARFVTITLSDVLGNDPEIIASGPTVASSMSRARAREVLGRYGLAGVVPAAVRLALNGDDAERDERIFDNDVMTVVADNQTAVLAAVDACRSDHRIVRVQGEPLVGEARRCAAGWIDRLDVEEADVVIAGGECTVMVTGAGIGGRNTEFALAAAMELDRRGWSEWTVASLATDGQDGPTGAAGAIADAGSIATARRLGIDRERLLNANDSLRFFEMVGGLVVTGPTGTNVNDLMFAVRTTNHAARSVSG